MQLAGTEKSGRRHRRYPLTASTRGRGGGIVADVDHLDTARAYYTASYTLERASTRRLFIYPASTDVNVAIQPVPDLATELPTRANGGISADGKTYTVHLRPGAKWNTSPVREMTSEDVVLGLKRLCNPVSPVGTPGSGGSACRRVRVGAPGATTAFSPNQHGMTQEDGQPVTGQSTDG